MAKSGYKRQLLPGAEELLKDLSKSGFKLAVISNNDGKTAEKCEQLGIAKYFELIIDSTNVNIIKPDKDIFLLASEKLGIDTKDILHIGDLYGADILGARNAGIDTIWINHKDGINYEEIKVTQVSNLLELSGLFKLT
jgi:putative hydrolase of the HAD superfamily